MKKQLTILEGLGIIAGPLFGYFVSQFVVSYLGRRLGPGLEGLGGLVVTLLIVGLVPAFLSVFLSGLIQSRRYKMINEGLSSFVIIVKLVILAFGMVRNLPTLAFWSLDVALSMSATLGAIHLWKLLAKPRLDSKVKTPVPGLSRPPEALEKVPRPSIVLSLLAILSIPFVIGNVIASAFITLGICAALLFLLMELPRIPIFLIIAGALAPLAALWATLTAIAAVIRPPKSSQAAITIGRETQPGLMALIEDVAARVGAQAPDKVILHLEPTFFVTRARIRLLDGEASGRVLALGMPLLKELSVRELQAVLAHEFAHFAGKDVLYSTIVAPAYRSLGVSFQVLSQNRIEGNIGAMMGILRLPSMLFLSASHEYFATIDRMLSRGRELRADRVAATLYGKANLVSSLEKATVEGGLYMRFLGSRPIMDPAALFTEVKAAAEADPSAREEVLKELRDRTEDPLDSHPSLAARSSSLPYLSGTAPLASPWEPASLAEDEKRLSSLAVSALGLRLAADEEEEKEDKKEGGEAGAEDPEATTESSS